MVAQFNVWFLIYNIIRCHCVLRGQCGESHAKNLSVERKVLQ